MKRITYDEAKDCPGILYWDTHDEPGVLQHEHIDDALIAYVEDTDDGVRATVTVYGFRAVDVSRHVTADDVIGWAHERIADEFEEAGEQPTPGAILRGAAEAFCRAVAETYETSHCEGAVEVEVDLVAWRAAGAEFSR